MKRIVLAIFLALSLVACTGSTEYGECVGLDDDRDPNLRYDIDTGNIIGAVIFSETIIVPLWVAFEGVWCPVGRKVQ